MYKQLFVIFLSLVLFTIEAIAQPSGGGQSGNSGVALSLGTPNTTGECLELDAQGNAISSGVACGAGGGATSEAQLEANLLDVLDVFTNNDGILAQVITDLTDVTAKSGNTTVVATAAGAFTPGDCLQIDASGNIVGTGSACSAAPATTEAGLEAQLVDVLNVFTNNDGALTDDDVSDDRPTDMLPMAHNVFLQALDSLAAAVDILKVDASNNTILNAKTGAEIVFSVNAISAWHASASALIGQLATSRIHTDNNANVLEIGSGSSTAGVNGAAMYLYGAASAKPGAIEFHGDVGQPFDINFNNINLGSSGSAWRTSTSDLLHAGGNVLGNTSDGADTLFFRACGGGSFTSNRGACISLGGNESPFPGNLRYSPGIGGEHDFEIANNVDAWRITTTGDFVNQGTNNVVVQPEAYGAGWNGSNEVPTKDAVYDKIETISGGGGGGANLITYYNHNFSWPAGTTAGVPLANLSITHSVGRPPDKIVVYFKGANGWYEHPDSRESGANAIGWDSYDSGVDENNITPIRIFGNIENALGNALVRLFWFSDDPLDTAVNGRTDISTAAGATITTGVEALTGNIVDAKAEYVMRINFGALPNTTTKSVAHGIASIFEVTNLEFMMKNATPEWLPLAYSSATNPRVFVDGTNVNVVTTSDFSTTTGIVNIYYTKP